MRGTYLQGRAARHSLVRAVRRQRPSARGGDVPAGRAPDGVHDLGGNVAEWVEDRRSEPQKTMRRRELSQRRALLSAAAAR